MATYYIDYNATDDSGAATKVDPWKRCPGMQGFSGSYSHSSGDIFVFKGGVTWPTTVFRIDIANGGASENEDQYTVDETWYSGGSWTRPIFDESTKTTSVFDPNVCTYIVFDNIEIKNGKFGFRTMPIADVIPAQYITIKNCYIHGSSEDGISARANNWTIEYNTFSDIGTSGTYRAIVFWPSTHASIDYDVSATIQYNTFNDGDFEDHIYLSGDNNTVYDNYFTGSGGESEHNDAIQLECTQHTTIEKNIFIDTGNFDIDAQTCSGGRYLDDTVIKGNLFSGIGGECIHLKEGTYEISGNTFLNSTTRAVRTVDNFAGRNPTYGTIKNNIFYSNTGSNSIYSPGSCTIDYNCYYNNGTLEENEDSGGNSFIDNPDFVNISNLPGTDGEYWTLDDGCHLQSSSPCVGTGETGIDIGAYEYNGPPFLTCLVLRFGGTMLIFLPFLKYWNTYFVSKTMGV